MKCEKGTLDAVVMLPNGNASQLLENLKQSIGSKERGYLAYLKTKSSAFKNAFKDSLIIDNNKEPMLMYHVGNNVYSSEISDANSTIESDGLITPNIQTVFLNINDKNKIKSEKNKVYVINPEQIEIISVDNLNKNIIKPTKRLNLKFKSTPQLVGINTSNSFSNIISHLIANGNDIKFVNSNSNQVLLFDNDIIYVNDKALKSSSPTFKEIAPLYLKYIKNNSPAKYKKIASIIKKLANFNGSDELKLSWILNSNSINSKLLNDLLSKEINQINNLILNKKSENDFNDRVQDNSNSISRSINDDTEVDIPAITLLSNTGELSNKQQVIKDKIEDMNTLADGETIEVEISRLPQEKRELLSKIHGNDAKTTVYRKLKPTGKGEVDFVAHRVSDAQSLKFAKNKNASELQRMENSTFSKLSRKTGTAMHKFSELYIKYLNSESIKSGIIEQYNDLLSSQGDVVFTAKDLNNLESKFFTVMFNRDSNNTDEVMSILDLNRNSNDDLTLALEIINVSNSYFNKSIRTTDEAIFSNFGVERVNDLTAHGEKKYYENGSEVFINKIYDFKSNEEYLENCAKLIKGDYNNGLEIMGMLPMISDIYVEAFLHQANIDPTKSAMVLSEQFVFDSDQDLGGTSDLVFIFSDGSASIYDYKFIKAVYKQGDFGQYVFDEEQSKLAFNRSKRQSYDSQLTTYAELLTKKYGVTKINKVRIRPFYVQYKTAVVDPRYPDAFNDSTRVLNMFSETSLIPLSAEKTNNSSIDAFIEKLEKQRKIIVDSLNKRRAWSTDFANVHKQQLIGDIIDKVKLSNDLSDYLKYVESYIKNVEVRLEVTDSNDIKYLNLKSIIELLEEKKLFDTFLKDTEELMGLFANDAVKYDEFKKELGDMMIRLNEADTDLNGLVVHRLKDIAKSQGMDEQIFDSYRDQPDINRLSALLLNMKSINHPLLRVFSQGVEIINTNRIKLQQKIKSDIENLNDKLTKWGQKKGIKNYDLFNIMLNENGDLVTKFNSKYYEDIAKNKEEENIGYFKAHFHRSTESINNQKSDEQRFQEAKKRYFDFLEQNYGNDEDEYVKTLKEKKREIWLDENDITYNNGVNKAWYKSKFKSLKTDSPLYNTYLNTNYAELVKPENKEAFDYYQYLISWNNKFREMIGDDFDIKSNFVPMIHKDFMETLSQGGSNMFKSYFYSIKNILNKDENEKMRHKKENDNKELPLMFMDFIPNDFRSKDLGKNLLIFATYISQYQDSKSLKDIGESIISVLKSTPEVKLDKDGNKIKELSGLSNFKGDVNGNKNLIEAMDVFINNYVYGETLQGDVLSNTLGEKGTRAALKLLNASSKRTMAFNIPSAIAGKVNAHFQTKMIASAGKYIKPEHIKNGSEMLSKFNPKLVYASYLFSIINDSSELKGNELSISNFRKFVGDDITYFFQKWADNSADINIMFAMMNNYGIDPITNKAERLDRLKEKYQTEQVFANGKAYPFDGKYKDTVFKSIWDSMIKVDSLGNQINEDPNESANSGSIQQLTSGKTSYVIVNQFTGMPLNFNYDQSLPGESGNLKIYDDKYNSSENKESLKNNADIAFTSFRSKTMELIGRIKGNMSSEDIATFQTTLIGKMLGQYRRWIPATMNARLKSEQYNLVMDEFEVGKWRSIQAIALNSYTNAAKQLAYGLIPFINHDFDSIDSPELKLKYEAFIQNNPSLKSKVTYEDYLKEYKGQLVALAFELRVVGGFILGAAAFFWIIPDDEEEDSVFFTGLKTLLERINLELGFFVPVPGLGLSETYKLFTKSPIALINDLKIFTDLVTNTFGEFKDVVLGADSNASMQFNLSGNEWFTQVKDTQGIGYNTSKLLNLGPVARMIGWNDTSDEADTIWENIFGQRSK